MKKWMAILVIIAVAFAVMAVPAFAHVHLFNPSDECSGAKNPQGAQNPAGKDVPSMPQGNNSQAFYHCSNNR
jgi:hypothetical protein